jgi:hypothetical protein
MNEQDIPKDKLAHGKVIISLSFAILIAFGAVTWWVLTQSSDATTKGAVLQTWNNLAIAVGAFWLGSSLGGKIDVGKK